KEAKSKNIKIEDYFNNKVSNNDWFFKSIQDQALVKHQALTFEKYLEMYGIRADKDYELACPRWYEISDKIKNRIDNYQGVIKKEDESRDLNEKFRLLADTSIKLQQIRSEAKHKTLIHIDKLRSLILQKNGNDQNIENLTRNELIYGEDKVVNIEKENIKTSVDTVENNHKSGSGI